VSPSTPASRSPGFAAGAPATEDVFALWDAIYGPEVGYLGLFSCLMPRPSKTASDPKGGRPKRQGTPRRCVTDPRQRFFPYPVRAPEAARWCREASDSGRDAFYCAHLLTARRRVKENAAPVRALWAEADGEDGEDLSAAPPPTAIVESSPGRRHLFWRLMRPLEGTEAEKLNRRLARATGADPSGWDLSQMTRPPGTRNRKYPEAPPVRLLYLDAGFVYHPRELDLALPELPEPPIPPGPLRPGIRPATHGPGPVDLSALSERMRRLAEAGNRGAGHPYPSRSEADFALAVAMFGKGYAEADVAAVLLDPALGISEKALSEGRHARAYVARTVGRAASAASPADPALARR
jgi:hypothetical protein